MAGIRYNDELMRIVVVIDNLSVSRGGAECYLLTLVDRLIAVGHDVHIFHNRGYDRVEGGKYHTVRSAQYPRFLREWDFCRQVDRQARALAADAVLTVRPLSCATHYRLSGGLHSLCFEAEREAYDSSLRRMFYQDRNEAQSQTTVAHPCSKQSADWSRPASAHGELRAGARSVI